MITVVDHVSPWLTPSSRFANSTQPQEGAHMSRTGTGTETSQPAHERVDEHEQRELGEVRPQPERRRAHGPVSSARPAARQSGGPCSSRCATKPRSRSKRTASMANTQVGPRQ